MSHRRVAFWTYDFFDQRANILTRPARSWLRILPGNTPDIIDARHYTEILLMCEPVIPLHALRLRMHIDDDTHHGGLLIAREVMRKNRLSGHARWLVVRGKSPEVAQRKTAWALTLLRRGGIIDHIVTVTGDGTIPPTEGCDLRTCKFAHGFIIPMVDTFATRSAIQRAALFGEIVLLIPLYRIVDEGVAIGRIFKDGEIANILRSKIFDRGRDDDVSHRTQQDT
jgi:hypothetical protein